MIDTSCKTIDINKLKIDALLELPNWIKKYKRKTQYNENRNLKVYFKAIPGQNFCCSNGTISLSLGSIDNNTPKEALKDLEYIFMHEMGHYNYSVFYGLRQFCNSVATKYKVPPEIVDIVNNILEDGRIENLMLENHQKEQKKLIQYRKTLRQKHYNLIKQQGKQNEITHIINAMIEYAVLKEIYEESQLSEKVAKYLKKIKPIIDKARNEKNPNTVRVYTENIIEILAHQLQENQNKYLYKKLQKELEEEMLKTLKMPLDKIPKKEEEDRIKKSLKEQAKQKVKIDKNNRRTKNKNQKENSKNQKENSLTQEEKKELRDLKMQAEADIFKEEKGKIKPTKLPKEEQNKAEKLNHAIKKIFTQKKTYNLKGQTKGMVDMKKLVQIKTKISDEVFKIDRENKIRTTGITLVLDGSGSMNHGIEKPKWKYAAQSLRIIEESLKDICKTRIVLYRSNYANINNIVIKDFDQEENINYTYSYQQINEMAKWGNSEYINIVHEGQELVKRGYNNKFIIVLSDGSPVSRSEVDADELLKNAVKSVKKKNITPISIYFGEDIEESQCLKNAYGSNNIFTRPENIYKELEKLLKKIVNK